MAEKRAASEEPKPEPKPKAETAGTPEHLGGSQTDAAEPRPTTAPRPYTGCGDPRRWRQRRRNR